MKEKKWSPKCISVKINSLTSCEKFFIHQNSFTSNYEVDKLSIPFRIIPHLSTLFQIQSMLLDACIQLIPSLTFCARHLTFKTQ